MVTREAIEAGVVAHSKWKKTLQEAIAVGKSDFKVTIVAKDNKCQFGQWLYGLPQEEKASDDWRKAVALHAEFHTVASEVLDLALQGKKAEALSKVAFGGSYSSISGRLVLCLSTWKNKLPK
jgi:hypothetical protein